jgi:glycosyltransferase involved in cell wall biosynthesis
MSVPLVSVCVPTHNRGQWLGQTLESILRQDYPQIEVLISDNASSDHTEELCQDLARKDSRIRYVQQQRNLGMLGNHNFCIEESRGALLCFFHDDDLYHPQIVSEYVRFFDQNPEAGLVGSDWDLINEQGATVGERVFPGKPLIRGVDYIDRTLRSGRSSLGLPAAMMRRSALGEVRFDESGPVNFADFIFWCRIAETTSVGHVSRRLWRYRVHGGSLSARSIVSTSRDYEEGLLRYCESYASRWPAQGRRARRWQAGVYRFLFWALAYEVARHSSGKGRLHRRTMSDLTDYTLTPEEREKALSLLRRYARGPGKRATGRLIEAMARRGGGWLFDGMTIWGPSLWNAVNFRTRAARFFGSSS